MGNFVDNSDKVIAAFDDCVEKALTEIGIHITTEAQDMLEASPRRVDTGLLRNSITFALDGGSAAMGSYSDDKGEQHGQYSGDTPKEGNGRAVYIGSNVEYASYVHEGTVKMSPNKFLRNAVEENQDQIKERLKAFMKS